MQRLPSERPDLPRGWRTREDPFAEVWSEVVEQLTREPGLQAKTLWDWLRQKYPGRFADGQVRTFQPQGDPCKPKIVGGASKDGSYDSRVC